MGCSNSKDAKEGPLKGVAKQLGSKNISRDDSGSAIDDISMSRVSYNNEPATLRESVAITFLNSCLEVTRSKFDLKPSAITEIIHDEIEKSKLMLLGSVKESMEERSVDDFFSKLLQVWNTENPESKKAISDKQMKAVLSALHIQLELTGNLSKSKYTFEDVLRMQFDWATSSKASTSLFCDLANESGVMKPEEYNSFMKDYQMTVLGDRQVLDKVKCRFGGVVHKYNFCAYNNSVLTNNAIDPTHANNVWQDMTQPFTHYMIRCRKIESEADLQCALHDGTRVFVLTIKSSGASGFYSGTCPLNTILQSLMKEGFLTCPYPIVLCISPESSISIPEQDKLADALKDTLGNMLAKGLMFEGAASNDPKFSPGALRKKILIMAKQARLKPFIGFFVADVNRGDLGVRVTDVMEGSSAAKAGISTGDWLTHFNEKLIKNKEILRTFLANLNIGDEFKIKCENISEVTVVTGGTIDESDTTCSLALSKLVFFKLVTDTISTAPWEIQVLPSEQLSSSKISRGELMKRFAYVSVDSPMTINDKEGKAANYGVQCIVGPNDEYHLNWKSGLFSDNGGCGYLLKTDPTTYPSKPFEMKILSGPRELGDAILHQVKATLSGNGTCTSQKDTIKFLNADPTSVAVIELTYEAAGKHFTFVASFGILSLRTGFRALSTIVKGHGGQCKPTVHEVFCRIQSL